MTVVSGTGQPLRVTDLAKEPPVDAATAYAVTLDPPSQAGADHDDTRRKPRHDVPEALLSHVPPRVGRHGPTGLSGGPRELTPPALGWWGS